MASLRTYRRFIVVARYFLPLLIAYARDNRRFLVVGGSRSVSAETRRRRAEYLLETLTTLGPTFIKLGQLLSTRPDVLPPEYVEVLTQLQDDVPPAPWEETEAVIEAEIGPVDERFDTFDTDAISGASLGQVYKAEIDGDPVAVKVRRPGVEDLVESDLQVMRWSVPILVRFLDEARAYSLRNLTNEFAKTIREEMDYKREREVLKEIADNFSDDDRIVIPDAIESHSGERILTMEYVGGTKITDVRELERQDIDRGALAITLQEAYMRMIIENGTFHADPHPGNLAVTEEGQIIFYDFGMSGRIDDQMREKIVDFYIAVANQNIDAILDAWVAIGALSPRADRDVMADVIEIAIENARGGNVDQYRVQQIITQMEDSLYEFPFRLPQNLALVLRVATVVEGVCVTLDPEFDFIAVAQNYLKEEGYREETAKRAAREVGQQMRAVGGSSVRLLPKLEKTLDRIERGNVTVQAELNDPRNLLERLALRFILGLLSSVGVISTALLYTFQSPESAGIVGFGTIVAIALLYRSFRSSDGVELQAEEFAERGFGRQPRLPQEDEDNGE